MELENIVRKRAVGKLSKFILKMAGGATPSVQEEEKYYSDENSGVPFIRVQNLNPTNELLLNDLKFINLETHENYLKRSKVFGNDLLVKITGVGRMAVSSVAPPNFEGNINQHLVVIKTLDRTTSETLATFLNTDIGEKLASRRATGGTRPALDYSALRSIPIVFIPETVEIIIKATTHKRALEAESTRLLSSVDGYLLERLGIGLPETRRENFFFVKSGRISGSRFDPDFHKKEYQELENNLKKIPCKRLSEVARFSSETWNLKDFYAETFPYIEISEIDLDFGTVKNIAEIKIEEAPSRARMVVRVGDLIVSTTRPGRGAIALIDETQHLNIASTGFAVLRHFKDVSAEYLHTVLRSKICLRQMEQRSSGGNYPAINASELSKILIPVPDSSVQAEIVSFIRSMRIESEKMRSEAADILAAAKIEIEQLILGKP